MPEKTPNNRPDSGYPVISIAWNIGTAMVLLVLSGLWLDHQFHSSGVFTIGGAVLGVLYSLFMAWTALK